MNLKPYPIPFTDITGQEYKDSGIEWLGKVPEGWEVIKIKRLAKKGYKNFIDGDWIESPYIKDEGIRLIQTGNIGVGIYKEQGFKYIDEEAFNSLRCTEVFPNDILICRLADPVGRACLAPVLESKMITSVDVCILKPSEKFDSRFIVYFLSTNNYLDYLDSLLRGGTRERISRSMLGNIEFAAPSLDEQTAIATFLDRQTSKIDELIKKNERLIELLKEKRQAVISHAVTKGLDPNAKMKDSGTEWIGEILEGWEVKKLKYVSVVNPEALTENINPEYELKYVDISNVGEEGLINEPITMSFGDAPSRARRIIRQNDVIVSTVRTYLKAIAYFPNSDFNLIVSTGFAVLRASDALLPKFLYYFVRSDFFINSIMSCSVRVSYPAINSSVLACLPVLLPDHDEQTAIIDFLDKETIKIEKLILKIQSQIEKLKEYRQALISNVVTGKVRVDEN